MKTKKKKKKQKKTITKTKTKTKKKKMKRNQKKKKKQKQKKKKTNTSTKTNAKKKKKEKKKKKKKRKKKDDDVDLWIKAEIIASKGVIYHLPSVAMLQNANNGVLGVIEDSQYLPLVASFSLILISLQDLAASSGVEPSGTKRDEIRLEIDDRFLSETN